MAIRQSRRPVGAARLVRTARGLLEASSLCAIATVDRSGRAYVNTAYFAWSRTFDLVWISERRATHSRNIRANETVAIAVYDSSQSWGHPDRGIQLFGSAYEAEGNAAELAVTIYGERFADYRADDMGAYRAYLFQPRRIKLFDERAVGAGTFVTARVGRGSELIWERTELYDSSS